MEIKRSGSEPSGKGLAEYLTGTVRVDPLFNPPTPAGAGEIATNAGASAVGNAIFDATGVRIRRAPFTPERVLKALKQG